MGRGGGGGIWKGGWGEGERGGGRILSGREGEGALDR